MAVQCHAGPPADNMAWNSLLLAIRKVIAMTKILLSRFKWVAHAAHQACKCLQGVIPPSLTGIASSSSSECFRFGKSKRKLSYVWGGFLPTRSKNACVQVL